MKVALGADPFAYSLKKAIATHLNGRGIEVVDTDNFSDAAYYDVAEKTAGLVAAKKVDCAVLLCGTGAGMCIVANKTSGAKAVCVESVFSAKKAKAINNANILTMGAMIVADTLACDMVDVWLDTKFTEGLEQFANFLAKAYDEVSKIDARKR